MLIVSSTVLVLWLAGCARDRAPTTSADGTSSPPPAPLTVKKGQDHLLFTYRDPDTADFATAETIEAIPEAARQLVVVVDLEVPPEARGAGRYVHVADLRVADEDGRYPVSVASRYGFGRTPERVGPDGAPVSKGVVLYSTSWCGVCKKAKRVLRQWKVPFEEKDIEASKAALEELGAKAARAGIRPGGVPVIDVSGELMQGLDETRLKALLQKKGLLGV